MASKLATLGGAALALLMVLSFSTSADARFAGGGFGGGHMGGFHMGGPRMGGFHMGGPRMFGPRHFVGPRRFVGPQRFVRSQPFVHRAHFARVAHFQNRRFFHRRFHRNVFFVAPFFAASYGYGDGCYWLRQNAVYTGSGYWWNRYYACLYGY